MKLITAPGYKIFEEFSKTLTMCIHETTDKEEALKMKRDKEKEGKKITIGRAVLHIYV